MSPAILRPERGATMVVGLIMLVLITVMLVAAMNLAGSNFRAVGNMQYRAEAITAANAAIQEVASLPFKTAPVTLNRQIDINNDGVPDLSVAVTPTCVAVIQVFNVPPSSLSVGPAMSGPPVWNTTWDLSAVVNDAVTGAAVRVRQGLRVQLADADRQVACP